MIGYASHITIPKTLGRATHPKAPGSGESELLWMDLTLAGLKISMYIIK